MRGGVHRQRSRDKSLSGLMSGGTLLDFTMGVLPTTLTWTRSSSATFVSRTGIVTTSATNIPRFEFQNGVAHLLVEGQATNLLNFSQTFDVVGGTQNNWLDTTLTRVSTTKTSPSGSTNAIEFRANAANSTVISTVALGTSALRTFSVWMRRVTGSGAVEMTNDNGTNWSPRTLSSVWTRFTLTSTNLHQVGIRITTLNDAVEIWGAQLEDVQIATSYIPTTTATAVRSADTAITNNFTSGRLRWPQYNTGTGTMFVEAAYRFRGVAGGYPRPINFISGAPTIAFGLFMDVNATSPSNLGPECQTDVGVLYANTANADAAMFKHAFTAYSSGLSAVIDQAISGVTGASATTVAVPSLTAANLHLNWNASVDMPVMFVRRIQYWPRRFTASELRQITVH